MSRRMLVFLVQQGVWDTPLESMPLACGYLKASALASDYVRENSEIDIHNFRGGVPLREMADQLFQKRVPDVLAFSVFGWNFNSAVALTETFKQLNPDGLVIFGGTHVSYQADRVFRVCPDVDVVVNGEGELTFVDLLTRRLDGGSTADFADIAGISCRSADGEVRTTPGRPQIMDLDEIPSPFLTGAIEMTNSKGEFRYDVALMETNRGCPYKCSFCYWGGATGQKVRSFSRQRLQQELEFFGDLGVHAIVACDANFGLMRQDKEFVDDFIAVRDRCGFPRSLETSWAKNKSNTFYDIVRTMKNAGMRSSFTLALQTLDDVTLDLMNRKNMKVNKWEELVDWLRAEGMECYAELIYDAPGETVESFLSGYDRLARKVSRIAVYPMLLLPNTEYAEKKSQLGIVSVRGDTDDFEHVLATESMSFDEHVKLRRFVFWARVIAENAVLRGTWAALRELGGLSQSDVLNSLDAWIFEADDPSAILLRQAAARGDMESIGAGVKFFYSDPEARRLLSRWWKEDVRGRLPADVVDLVDEIHRHDLDTLPLVARDGQDDLPPVVVVRGEEYYLRENTEWNFDIPAALVSFRSGERPSLVRKPTVLNLYYRKGAENVVTTTNHETIMHFMGIREEEVMALAAANADGAH